MSKICPVDSAPFVDSYLQYVITTPLALFMQSLLIYNSIKHYKELKKIDIKIRILYFSVQISTAIFLFIELLKLVLLPRDVQNSSSQFYCNLASYSNMICIFCYFVLLLYLFYRLDFTFRNSVYRLSLFSRIFSTLFLCIPPLSSIIIFPILADNACIWEWHPFDGHLTKTPNLYLCATNYSSNNHAIYVVYVCLVWDIVMNIIIAGLFYRKLEQLLNSAGGGRGPANKHTIQTKRLMIKNTILTVCCVVSTLISWVLWLIFNTLTFGKCIVYFDLWLNGFCIALMFKFNEKYYKKLCGRCTKCIVTKEQLKINIGILDESTRITSNQTPTHEVIPSGTDTYAQRMELAVNNNRKLNSTKDMTDDENDTRNQLMATENDAQQAVITDDEDTNSALP